MLERRIRFRMLPRPKRRRRRKIMIQKERKMLFESDLKKLKLKERKVRKMIKISRYVAPGISGFRYIIVLMVIMTRIRLVK